MRHPGNTEGPSINSLILFGRMNIWCSSIYHSNFMEMGIFNNPWSSLTPQPILWQLLFFYVSCLLTSFCTLWFMSIKNWHKVGYSVGCSVNHAVCYILFRITSKQKKVYSSTLLNWCFFCSAVFESFSRWYHSIHFLSLFTSNQQYLVFVVRTSHVDIVSAEKTCF